jgi:hypothetical protein
MPIRVSGLRSFLQATDRAGRQTKRLVREDLAAAAEPVRADAQRRFTPINPGSAAAYRVSVRRAGWVMVVSSKRKTTGLHPEYGALQMRMALIPALEANEAEVAYRLGLALDHIADELGRP